MTTSKILPIRRSSAAVLSPRPRGLLVAAECAFPHPATRTLRKNKCTALWLGPSGNRPSNASFGVLTGGARSREGGTCVFPGSKHGFCDEPTRQKSRIGRRRGGDLCRRLRRACGDGAVRHD